MITRRRALGLLVAAPLLPRVVVEAAPIFTSCDVGRGDLFATFLASSEMNADLVAVFWDDCGDEVSRHLYDVGTNTWSEVMRRNDG